MKRAARILSNKIFNIEEKNLVKVKMEKKKSKTKIHVNWFIYRTMNVLENDEESAMLRNALLNCENDEHCILNGTKWQLIGGDILTEPLRSTAIAEKNEMSDSTDQVCSAAAAYAEFVAKTEKGNKAMEMKKQITHKHNIAKMRLIDRGADKHWKNELESMFWGVEQWPPYIIEIMLDNGFGYQNRLAFASFFHGHGLDVPHIATNTFKRYNKHWKDNECWNYRFFKFEQLWQYLNKANHPANHDIRSKYYYFDMNTKHMMYYDNSKRERKEKKEYVRHNRI